MGTHEHRDHVVLGELVLLEPLLPPALVLLLVLRLQLLGAAAVVAREPPDVWEEVAKAAQEIPQPVTGHLGELPGLLVLLELEDGNDGDVVEVEGAVDLDPLQANVVVIAGLSRDELEPDVLGDKVVLVLSEGELHLQPPLLLVEV